MSSVSNEHLEKMFAVPARLKIMTLLMVRASEEFTVLLDELNLTRGNLSMHMKVLGDSGYVDIRKKFVKNKPKTTYRITAKGRRDFAAYIERLELIIGRLKSGEEFS